MTFPHVWVGRRMTDILILNALIYIKYGCIMIIIDITENDYTSRWVHYHAFLVHTLTCALCTH